jgi:nucleoid DNA-binding protein
LREGKTVVLPGFGTFLTRDKKEGQVRHVQAGEVITYPARRVAAFRPGEFLKRAVRRSRRRGGGRRKQEAVEDESLTDEVE